MGFSWPVHAQRKLQFDVTRTARTRDEADDKVFNMLLYNVAYDLDGTKTGPYLSKGIESNGGMARNRYPGSSWHVSDRIMN